MGLFGKKVKPNKDYDMSETLKILSQPQYRDYTAIDVGGGIYHIIPVKESKRLERQLRERESAKNVFHERINGGGQYANQGVADIIDLNEYKQTSYEEREIG